MKDHEIRELVNQLRDIAIEYHSAGQLREKIARTVRAAILQAQSDDDGEPTDDERIMAIEGIHNCEWCGDEGWVVGEMGNTRCACNQGNPVFKIDLNSDFIKHVKAVSEKVRAGNSPVIGIDLASGPDRTVEVRYVAPPGYVMVPVKPTREILDEFDSIIDYGAEDSVDAWHRLLAAAPQSIGSDPATVPGKWIPVSEHLPDPKSEQRVCVYTPTPHEDMRYRFVPASLFRAVCSDATHWYYMEPPAAPQEVPDGK